MIDHDLNDPDDLKDPDEMLFKRRCMHCTIIVIFCGPVFVTIPSGVSIQTDCLITQFINHLIYNYFGEFCYRDRLFSTKFFSISATHLYIS